MIKIYTSEIIVYRHSDKEGQLEVTIGSNGFAERKGKEWSEIKRFSSRHSPSEIINELVSNLSDLIIPPHPKSDKPYVGSDKHGFQLTINETRLQDFYNKIDFFLI